MNSSQQHSSAVARPRRVEPVYQERIWGSTSLEPYFATPERRIGEVWFQPSPDFPLLVKFLFTSDRLSIQVHPDDAQAHQRNLARGKTEMWHVLRAGPDARIVLGFRKTVSKEQVREAVDKETIENLLNSVPVKAGDALLAEAGVVHAIGADIVLCEIQQSSDTTYRLYDYGRRRELHLEEALSVAKLDPYDGRRQYPVTCEYFRTERLQIDSQVLLNGGRDSLLIVLEGAGRIAGEHFGEHFEPGHVWHLPGAVRSVEVTPHSRATLLHTSCGST